MEEEEGRSQGWLLGFFVLRWGAALCTHPFSRGAHRASGTRFTTSSSLAFLASRPGGTLGSCGALRKRRKRGSEQQTRTGWGLGFSSQFPPPSRPPTKTPISGGPHTTAPGLSGPTVGSGPTH